MDAFILETLLTRGWRRGGEVFWTRADAERSARELVRRKLAKAARVLQVRVDLNAVSEIPNPILQTA